jgi:hypothetical protein
VFRVEADPAQLAQTVDIEDDFWREQLLLEADHQVSPTCQDFHLAAGTMQDIEGLFKCRWASIVESRQRHERVTCSKRSARKGSKDCRGAFETHLY